MSHTPCVFSSGIHLRFIKNKEERELLLSGWSIWMCVCVWVCVRGILSWPPASISWAHLTTVAYPVPPFIVIVWSYWGVGPIRWWSCHGCPTTNYRILQPCIACPDASGGREGYCEGGRDRRQRGSCGGGGPQETCHSSAPLINPI